MAPTTAASGGGSRQTTLGSWAFNQTGLWQPAGRRSTSQVTRSAPAQPLVYQITETTQLLLQRADITLFDGDAIVNAANERMLGGGGVDGAIHRAAGPELRDACREVRQVAPGVRCPTGEARITPGFDLSAKAVIHAVGPVYEEEDARQCQWELASAYRECLRIANEEGMKRIAFPAISCGVYGYPIAKAAMVSMEMVKRHAGGLNEVAFLMHDKPAWEGFRHAAAERAGPLVSGPKDQQVPSDDENDSEEDVLVVSKAPRRSQGGGSPASSPRAASRSPQAAGNSLGGSARGSPGGNGGSPDGSRRTVANSPSGSPQAAADRSLTSAAARAAAGSTGSGSGSGGDGPWLSKSLFDSTGSGGSGGDGRNGMAFSGNLKLLPGGESRLRSREIASHPLAGGSPRHSAQAAAMAAPAAEHAAAASPAADGPLITVEEATFPGGSDPFPSLQDTEDQVAGVADVQLGSTARTTGPPVEAASPPRSPCMTVLLADAARHRAATGNGAEPPPQNAAAAAAGNVAQPDGTAEAPVPVAADAAAAAAPMDTDDGQALDATTGNGTGGAVAEAAASCGSLGEDPQISDDDAAEAELRASKKQRPSP